MRLALGTTDGLVINQHFGHSPVFSIVDINEHDWSWSFVEQRQNIPACQAGSHDSQAFKKSIENLKDCDTVLVSRIGAPGRMALEMTGKQVLEIKGYVDEVLAGYINYLKKRRGRHGAAV